MTCYQPEVMVRFIAGERAHVSVMGTSSKEAFCVW
jgi:hypothetical protein